MVSGQLFNGSILCSFLAENILLFRLTVASMWFLAWVVWYIQLVCHVYGMKFKTSGNTCKRAVNLESLLWITSQKFWGPGFWIPTKGILKHPKVDWPVKILPKGPLERNQMSMSMRAWICHYASMNISNRLLSSWPLGKILTGLAWEGDIIQTDRRTCRLLDQLSPDGRVGENPAYGRQSISRPMLIVAPIPQ